ncbi:aminotransferase class I/II-fold pyridoxal phosphate-dependent enzyme [Nocardiopsis synnemataformans]|uniref:aminotransferase class I/II-fold pyridoxal phosphate-dependent enzyme n=1 Tax=Nocardiopsis synnemataformans TaxID=61305 RepID=UPI003EBFFDE9
MPSLPPARPRPRLWPLWSDAARAQVGDLLTGGDLTATTLTPPVRTLEHLVEHVLAPGRHVLATGSGTAALATAYVALGLEPGAQVLAPAHTFRATVTAMLAAHLVPVLCETDPATGGIDLDDAAARVTGRTQALVATHTWGRPLPAERLRAFADRHHLALVEDCSHAHGARRHGEPVGARADVAVWSLGTTKLASGGMLGALATPDPALFARALAYGQPKHRCLASVHDSALRRTALSGVGANLRPSPVAAVLAADHLARLEQILALKNRRQAAVEHVLAGLPELALEPLARAPGHDGGALYKWHWHHSDPGRVLPALAGAGLRVRRPAPGLHTLPLFTDPDLARALVPGAPRLPPAGPRPATDAFLAGLIEADTRDVYDPDCDPLPLYRDALHRAAAHPRHHTN